MKPCSTCGGKRFRIYAIACTEGCGCQYINICADCHSVFDDDGLELAGRWELVKP